MEDILMMKHLKDKEIGHMSEEDFMNKFKEFMYEYKKHNYTDDYELMSYEDDFLMNKTNMKEPNIPNIRKIVRRSTSTGTHFDEHKAKHVVSHMHHTEDDRKYMGEKYSMYKAKEIAEKYKSILPHDVTPCDIYVAINAQYHDYSELFKSWFGSNIDKQIIESALVFWFMDTDYTKGFKLGNYFKES